MMKSAAFESSASGRASPREGEASVPARVAKAIQDMIVAQRLQPGDALPSQRQLTVMFQASRPSVREGLSMLETLGLIRVEKRKGLFVAAQAGRPPADLWPFDQGYGLREVFQFRATFEPAALALAFPFFSNAALARLRQHADGLRTAARDGSALIAAQEDTAFHDVIFDMCPNPIFRDIRRQLGKAMQDSQWVPMVIIDRVRETANEHFAIVDALDSKDCGAACDALAYHIRAAARRCDLELG